VQSEIPTHHPSFGKAVVEMLRQKPDVILVGESRDEETIRNTALACQTGHTAYTTIHTNSVGETIGRMTEEFPGPERDAVAMKLLAAMRVLIHQRLIRKADGSGRVPVREWLVFDPEVKRKLCPEPWSRWPFMINDILSERGQSAFHAAQRAWEAGLISEESLLAIEGGA
ncbi:MAG: ATPase, T2SS/T4P/T4SS family, partial [Leptospirales bacterium]